MTLHRSQRLAGVAAAALLAGTTIAACGSSSPSSGGHPAQAQLQQGQQDAIRFVQCLRSRGVTNVPDPTLTSGRAFKGAMSGDAQSPAFRSAYAACHHLLPNGGPPSQHEAHSPAQIAAFVAFARCLRSHGFNNFPDPTSSGLVTHEMLANAGLSLHQPSLLMAGLACTSVTHGLLTRAAVERALNGG
jgi:hypothetical protein